MAFEGRTYRQKGGVFLRSILGECYSPKPLEQKDGHVLSAAPTRAGRSSVMPNSADDAPIPRDPRDDDS